MGLPVYESLGLSLACSLSNAWEEKTQKRNDLNQQSIMQFNEDNWYFYIHILVHEN